MITELLDMAVMAMGMIVFLTICFSVAGWVLRLFNRRSKQQRK